MIVEVLFLYSKEIDLKIKCYNNGGVKLKICIGRCIYSSDWVCLRVLGKNR